MAMPCNKESGAAERPRSSPNEEPRVGWAEGPEGTFVTVSVPDGELVDGMLVVEPEQGPRPPGKRRRLGRFTVLGTLGHGGMGTVLEAYDDTLARTVALKLLRGNVARDRQERLLREAQALARLSHPNVVQVYEVGLVEGQMFIAMELVGGKNLRQWQRTRRPWSEVVSAYLQAGRGLMAAHKEGLIHRDFKPENCIIGDNGRVRVLDFGLARGSKTVDESTDPVSMIPFDQSALHERLTQTGKVLGTMSYLPFQQLCGVIATPSTDQFSFCVSLYEALYGVVPFRDRSMHELMAAQREGRLQPTPAGVRIPRRLRRILLRGLSKDPRERWPSMEPLLEALQQLLEPRRWRAGIVMTTLVAGFATGALAVAEARSAGPCDRPDRMMEKIWSTSDRQAVDGALRRSGYPDAKLLAGRVGEQIDTYAQQWAQTYDEVCHDAEGRYRPSARRRTDRRIRCLQRARGRLEASILALSEVHNAAEAFERAIVPFKLIGLEACAALEGDESMVALPDEPGPRARIDAVQRMVDQANTLADAGVLESAISLAKTAVAEARAVDHRPVLASALETLGRLQVAGLSASEGESVLREAIEVGAQAKDDAIVARAWSSVIHALMIQNKMDRALSLGFAANVAVERADDAIARGWLFNNLGALYGQQGELGRARDYYQRALQVKEQSHGPEHLDVGIAWFNLANALIGERADQSERAIEAFDRAHSIFIKTVGESHPHVASVEEGMGQLRRTQGQWEQAAEHHQNALQIRTEVWGPSHTQVAHSLESLGLVRWDQGQLDDAAEHLRRAQQIYRHEGGGRLSVEPSARLGPAFEHRICSRKSGDRPCTGGAGGVVALGRWTPPTAGGGSFRPGPGAG